MTREQEIIELQKQLATCSVAAKEMAILRKIRELTEEGNKSVPSLDDKH